MNNEDQKAIKTTVREGVRDGVLDVLMRLFDCKTVPELMKKIQDKEKR